MLGQVVALVGKQLEKNSHEASPTHVMFNPTPILPPFQLVPLRSASMAGVLLVWITLVQWDMDVRLRVVVAVVTASITFND